VKDEDRRVGRDSVKLVQVGSRFSANWCSVKPPTTRTHCGGGVTATWRLSMDIASESDRTPSQRSSML
jgi:hypothetical protein